jgi:hypothetical protein
MFPFMKPSVMTFSALLVSSGLTCLLPVFGQVGAPARATLLAMAANTKRVVHYDWKQRITIVRKGNPSEPIIDRIHFDSSGQMQRTTVSAPPQKEMRGIRGRVAAGVKEDVKGIMELVGQYNKPQQMVEAIRKARISPAANGGATTLQASDLIQPADTMTMLVDSTTHLAKHVDIRTKYDGAPVTIAQDYGSIPNGPNMMKSMRVSAPSKDLAINVDSYDFTQQSARGN